MRHNLKDNHLGRTTSHRFAMLSNMASSLLIHKRIQTTLAKAKVLRRYVEPLITKSKSDVTHNRRVVFSYLQNKYAVKALFTEIAPAIAERPGGYTRILKLGPRKGDNAEMALIELVDFNPYLEGDSIRKKSRRQRRKDSVQGGIVQSTEARTSPVVEDAQLIKESIIASSVTEVAPEVETIEPTTDNVVEISPAEADAPINDVADVADDSVASSDVDSTPKSDENPPATV